MSSRFIVAARALAFVNFLFLPAIGVLVLASFITRDTGWVLALGLPALVFNMIALLIEPVRSMVWRRLDVIAGQSAKPEPR